MGKLATTGGRVTRDNEEREASVWSVERSGAGASSGRAFVAVYTDEIVVVVVGGGGGGTIVRTIDTPEQNDSIRSDSGSEDDDSTRRTEAEIEKGYASASSPISEKREIERTEETALAFSLEERESGTKGTIDRRSIERRCRYRRREFHPIRRIGPRANAGLFVLLGLAAIGAALCVPASGVPMPSLPSGADPLARTGLRYNLDRSTGLEDVYEDAFENAFREEDRATTRTVLDDAELDIIRRSIVRGLGLKRIPDPSKANVSQAEYERAHREYLRKVQLQSDERSFDGNRRLHVFHATAYPGNESSQLYERSRKDEERHRHRHRLFFPVEIPDEESTVDHATLRLLLHGPSDEDPRGSPIDALLYLKTSRSRKLLVRDRIEPENWRNPRWLEFDSSAAVSFWLAAGTLENFGLELEFVRDGRPIERTFSSPVLNVFTVTADFRARAKRSTPEQLMSLHQGRRSKCKGESKKCCRHELTVMFKDLKGFEFIVYPKTFDAGYCKGRCPPRYNPAHHHALLQSLLWKEDRKKVPKPCCAPSKLDQLMIVYFDEDDSTQLKVSYWQNIQVLECACS
ncbi:TGF-beta domain-containing family member maverick [Megachile rotundata]|uniref:TGF-beta domain-containing family member maverick n=1 Tax=Megachile rotundata TaxID=143995 RepID=UPI003FD39ED6